MIGVIIQSRMNSANKEVFSFKTLEKCWKNDRLKSEREHVTSYIVSHP